MSYGKHCQCNVFQTDFFAKPPNDNGAPSAAAAEDDKSAAAETAGACSVLEGEDGVLFVRKPDGRATGDAFVLFSEEQGRNSIDILGKCLYFGYLGSNIDIQAISRQTRQTKLFRGLFWATF